MTKSSIEMAKQIISSETIAGVSSGSSTFVSASRGDGAEIGRRLLVLPADREQAPAHDHHHVGERERHMAEHLGERAGVDEREEMREDE